MQNGKFNSEGAASPGVVAGAIIMGMGVLLLLHNLHVVYIREVMRYWPMILVAVGLAMCLDNKSSAGRLWGGLLMVAGLVLLGRSLGFYPLQFRVMWPAALIVAGGLLLWSAAEGWGGRRTPGDESSELRNWAVFGGGKRQIGVPDFRGGEVLAIFGGYEIDLRDASIAGERAVITANAVFGGIEVRVPRTWRVETHGAAVLGGFEDKTAPPPHDQVPAAKVLIVRGSAILGGVEIKN